MPIRDDEDKSSPCRSPSEIPEYTHVRSECAGHQVKGCMSPRPKAQAIMSEGAGYKVKRCRSPNEVRFGQ